MSEDFWRSPVLLDSERFRGKIRLVKVSSFLCFLFQKKACLTKFPSFLKMAKTAVITFLLAASVFDFRSPVTMARSTINQTPTLDSQGQNMTGSKYDAL